MHLHRFFLGALSVSLMSFGLNAAENYPVHPDSEVQEGVPRGEVKGPFPFRSEIFPGTERDYWIYVPAQYDPAKPAAVMIFQDGLGRAREWKLPVVLDNLIHKKEVPVTIGLFVMHGIVPAPNENAQPRFNRSFEYDGMGDRYARFLIEELLPAVSKSYNLSDDPNDRLIAGASSGGICAFNAAWERPDAFRRVLSTIGTFVGLRGGHDFPTLVRKHEPKPIRVFLQDGSNDLNIYAGDWWAANQQMLSALEWSGYDVNHVWGEGGHNGRQGAAIMPEALKWLWRDYPEPIKKGRNDKRRIDILIEGEDWVEVSSGHRFTEGPAVNQKGELFFTDIPNNRIHKAGLDGEVSVFAEKTGGANGLMFGADGQLYACANGKRQIVAYQPGGAVEVIAEGVESNDLIGGPEGIWFTDPNNRQVHYVDVKTRETRMVDSGIGRPNGIILSPDKTQLYVVDTSGPFGYVFRVGEKGALEHKQEYLHLHIPYGQNGSGADGMTVDKEGRIYVTTRMGVQVCDQLGRVNLILDKPSRGWLSNAVFGGPRMDTLYVTCGEKVFKRKLKTTGAAPWQDPVELPRPGL